MNQEQALTDFAESLPQPQDVIASLNDAITRYRSLRGEVDQLRGELDEKTEALKRVMENELPDLMEQAGFSEYVTSDGLKVQVTETIRANISKDRQEPAFQWLKDNGAVSLIEPSIIVRLPKGVPTDECERMANAVGSVLEQENRTGQAYPYALEHKVHASTLSAWVREKLRQGVELPHELLGIFRQRAAKISGDNRKKGAF